MKKSRRVEEQESTSLPTEVSEKRQGFWQNVAWGLLLFGGLAHMLPEQMAPLLKWSTYGVTLQMAVGTFSVVVALYYLLGE